MIYMRHGLNEPFKHRIILLAGDLNRNTVEVQYCKNGQARFGVSTFDIKADGGWPEILAAIQKANQTQKSESDKLF